MMRAFWLQFSAWLRNEWRLIRLDTWAEEPRSTSPAGSVADPRVARMDLRQRAYGKRLRREGRSLLSGKEYTPALTKEQPAPPPKSGKVVPIRKRQQ